MAKPVVANGVHLAGQNVAQVAADELDAGDGRCFDAVALVAVFPAEGDRRGIAGHKAAVGDGGAAHVGPEVFDGGLPRAEGPDVHAPAGAPHGRVRLPIQGLEALAELMPEAGLEGRDVDEELFAFPNDHAAIGVDPGGGHDEVEVGEEEELLVPGVEDRGEPAGRGTEPFGVGEAVPQSLCCGCKEDVVGGFGQRAEKHPAQLGGQREGDHEIRRVDSLGQLP